jgi:hypothetical protein
LAQQTLNLPRESTHERIADALENMVDKIVDTSSASNIDYDNTQSGLDADKVQGAVDELAEEKVDKETGKGLSTNDYTDADKNKLAGIEAEANKTVVDSAMNDRSTNPLQNRVITVTFDEKTDVNKFNALTQEFELFNTYDLSNDVEISVFANKTYKKDKYDDSHVPNLDGEYSVSLGDKTFTETCTFTIANEGKSITEVFHTNRKYILGAKLLKAENDEVGDAHVIADVVTLTISKDAPYTTTFDPYLEHPPVTGVLTLKVSVKPDEKYVNKENTGGPSEYAYWGSYNGSDLMINNPILTYSETTFGQPKVSGNPITIKDAAEANAVDVSVDIEPIQDLHGYDNPWAGGAGKNLIPMTVANLKSANTSGTWSGNSYVYGGITYTIQTDSGGNVTGINADGTSTSSYSPFYISSQMNVESGKEYIINGSPQSPSSSTWRLWVESSTAFPSGNRLSDDTVGDSRRTAMANETVSVYIQIFSGQILSNKMFYPMIRLATVSDATFAPYSNISPITGQTEVVIDDCGKNLIGKGTQIDGLVDITTMKFISTRNGHGYYFRTTDLPDVITMSATNGNRAYYAYFNEVPADNVVCLSANQSQTTLPNTITVDKTYKYIHLQFSYGVQTATNIQVEAGSTATTYEPYKGKTYTIQLGDTIYGGELDVITGELTVDRASVDLGSLTWTTLASGRHSAFISNGKFAPTNTDIANALSSQYKVTSATDIPNIDSSFCYGANGVANLLVNDSRYNGEDATAFKTAMNGVQLVYELATPYTIQLTQQQIRLLKGTNNISCNTGDLSIKYYPDNVLGQLKGDIESEYDAIIQNLLERIEALENQQ